MKNLYRSTSINGETSFTISICESLGWIEPVYLLISPNLKETLKLSEEYNSLSEVTHFKILYLEKENCYAIHFSDGTVLRGNTSELKIIKAEYTDRKEINKSIYSIFTSSYCFKEISNYQEYCFYIIANNISYLCAPNSFSVEDYS